MPHGVVGSREINKHGSSILFAKKLSSMSWVMSVTWTTVDLLVYYQFDMGIDDSLEDLKRDT